MKTKRNNKLLRFEKHAKELGAITERFAVGKHTKFQIIHSSTHGGCDLPRCNCSPGLWISAFQGKEGVTSSFGSNIEISEIHKKLWNKLKREFK